MDNKKVLSVVFCVAIALFFIIFSANIYISNAENEEVYFFGDLKIGDYIPGGAKLLMNTYFYSSDYIPKDSMEISYYIDGKYSHSEKLDYDSMLILPKSYNGEYDGWKIIMFSCNKIIIESVKKDDISNPIIQKPSKDNGYKIVTETNSFKEFNFYKADSVKPSVDQNSEFRNGVYCLDSAGKITYESNLPNDKIITFKMKSLSQLIRINDQPIQLSNLNNREVLEELQIYYDYYIKY